jgi:hypothetical protein
MTAHQSPEPGPKNKEPGVIERGIADLEDHYEHGEHGDETGYERPDVEEEREEREHQPNAEHFRHLTDQFEQQSVERRDEQREAVAQERREKVMDFAEHPIGDEHWSELIHSACEAAKAGKSEFQLLRFPSQLCSDSGRAINAGEEAWPETLRGEAHEIHQRWAKDLKPQGFRLTARIVDFPDGIPGDVGLFLTWNR